MDRDEEVVEVFVDQEELVLVWIKRFRSWMRDQYPGVDDPSLIMGLAVEFVDTMIMHGDGIDLSSRMGRGLFLRGLALNWDELGEWGVPRETIERG